MSKTDFRSKRYVWSKECGGCIMLQTREDGSLEWKDSDSREEGSYPTYTKAVAEIVKWYNLQLRIEAQNQKIYLLEQQVLKLEAQKAKLLKRQLAHSEKYRALTTKES